MERPGCSSIRWLVPPRRRSEPNAPPARGLAKSFRPTARPLQLVGRPRRALFFGGLRATDQPLRYLLAKPPGMIVIPAADYRSPRRGHPGVRMPMAACWTRAIAPGSMAPFAGGRLPSRALGPLTGPARPDRSNSRIVRAKLAQQPVRFRKPIPATPVPRLQQTAGTDIPVGSITAQTRSSRQLRSQAGTANHSAAVTMMAAKLALRPDRSAFIVRCTKPFSFACARTACNAPQQNRIENNEWALGAQGPLWEAFSARLTARPAVLGDAFPARRSRSGPESDAGVPRRATTAWPSSGSAKPPRHQPHLPWPCKRLARKKHRVA